MSISVSCSCGKTLNVKDELAGKRGKCPKCGALLTIPQPPKPAEPELLDLPSLSDEFDAPAAAEVIPEAVKLARARSGWVDPSIETEFKLAGDPLSDDVGKVFAPPPMIAPLKDPRAPREEVEGEFVCPRCGCGLERTYSLLNILVMFASSATTGFYLRPTTPYLCRVCDVGIRYEDLRGASRRTADRRAAKLKLGCLIAFLTFGGLFGGCYMIVAGKVKEEQQRTQEWLEEQKKQGQIQRAEYEKQRAEQDQRDQEKRKLEEEQRKKKEADDRKAREEREKQRKEQQQKRLEEQRQSLEKNALPRPNNPPVPAKPPPQPANPFQPVD